MRLSENPIYKASSVTVHGTCYKKDLNTIWLAQPVFGSLEKIWLCSRYIFGGLKLYHGEEFETGMRSDNQHLENFGVLLCREFK